MRSGARAAAIVVSVGLIGLGGCQRAKQARAARASSGPHATAPSPPLHAQPKPGERVRQPELDGYCSDAERPAAFYYHGGNPAVRVARRDACAPLYLTECESEGRCYPPRDQEPGMWCCAPKDAEQPTAHATR